MSGRAKNDEFDERLSRVGLMLDSLSGGMRAVNQRTQVMVGLRDILRQVKALAAEEGADSAEELAKCVVERQSKLEMQVAAGTITKAKRGQEEVVIAELSELARVCAVDGFAAVEARYGQMVASIAPETQEIESKNVWGYYAKMQGGDWPKRFECEVARYGVRLQLKGIAAENETIQFFIPMLGRNRRTDVYVFSDGEFNEEAVDYCTSISGTFTCLDMEFAGTYDIFVGPRLIIFERWEFDKLGNRLNDKGETKMCCSCR